MLTIEQRIFSGQWNQFDREWIAFLDLIFDEVELTDFSNVGMSIKHTRRFLNLLAMARRMEAELEQAA